MPNALGRLSGQRAFVAGGAGAVGEGVVRQLLEDGADVVASSRSTEKLEALERAVGGSPRLRLVTAAWDEPGVATVEQELQRCGGLDLAVASLGPWWHVPNLTELDPVTWRDVLEAGLTAHFMAAKALVPSLREGGSYILVNGGAALSPVPTAGPVSIVAAAQLMFKEVLAIENSLIRVNTLLINTLISTRERPDPDPSWVTAEDVGRAAGTLHLSEGTSGQTFQLNSRSDIESFV